MRQTKNKNEALARLVSEKEQTILDLQSQNQRLENECSGVTEQLMLANAKTKALEVFSTELQQKHDSLNLRYKESMAKVNELTKCELPAKLLEYKQKCENLEKMCLQREHERDLYAEQKGGDSQYQK